MNSAWAIIWIKWKDNMIHSWMSVTVNNNNELHLCYTLQALYMMCTSGRDVQPHRWCLHALFPVQALPSVTPHPPQSPQGLPQWRHLVGVADPSEGETKTMTTWTSRLICTISRAPRERSGDRLGQGAVLGAVMKREKEGCRPVLVLRLYKALT